MSRCFDECLWIKPLKGVDFRCISRDETVNKLNNSMLGDKGLF